MRKKYNANEKTEESTYINAKEKVIGATFKYKANIDDAIAQFINEIENKKLKQHINKNISFIKEIISASKYDNLRFVKRFFMDFERLFISLKDEHKTIDELIKRLLAVNLILKIESIINNLSPKELHDAKIDDGKGSLAYEITKKYNYYPFRNSVLSLDAWDLICQDNFIDKERIDREIQNSLISTTEEKESWVKLWDYSLLGEEDFNLCMLDVESKLKNHLYENENVIKHLLGVFIELHEKNVIGEKYNELSHLCYESINTLSKNHKLDEIDSIYNAAFLNESWAGLAFHSRIRDEFTKFIQFIESKRIEQESSLYPKIQEQIINLIMHKDEKYRFMLTPNNREIKSYYNKPILSDANAKHFCEGILKSDELRVFCMTLNTRYTRNGVAGLLSSEINFVNEMINELNITSDQSIHPLTKLKIKEAIKYFLDPSIKELKSIEKAS